MKIHLISDLERYLKCALWVKREPPRITIDDFNENSIVQLYVDFLLLYSVFRIISLNLITSRASGCEAIMIVKRKHLITRDTFSEIEERR